MPSRKRQSGECATISNRGDLGGLRDIAARIGDLSHGSAKGSWRIGDRKCGGSGHPEYLARRGSIGSGHKRMGLTASVDFFTLIFPAMIVLMLIFQASTFICTSRLTKWTRPASWGATFAIWVSAFEKLACYREKSTIAKPCVVRIWKLVQR